MSARSFVGKCKKCKRALQVSAVAVETRAAERSPRDGRVISPKRVRWEIVVGALKGQRTGLDPAWNGKWQIALACPKCHEPTTVNAVAGVYSERHECGARCMASTGPNCECSCGGANHGKAHAW